MNTLGAIEVKPWYRERWPWLLMAGPFLAIVGCAITIYFAVTQFGNQALTDGATKRGLVVEKVNPPAIETASPRGSSSSPTH